MATDNHQVTIYLPDETLEFVTDYCIKNGITRRKNNTPMLATGIIDILNKANESNIINKKLDYQYKLVDNNKITIDINLNVNNPKRY